MWPEQLERQVLSVSCMLSDVETNTYQHLKRQQVRGSAVVGDGGGGVSKAWTHGRDVTFEVLFAERRLGLNGLAPLSQLLTSLVDD